MKKCQQILLCDLDGTLANYDKNLYKYLKQLIPEEEFKKLPKSLHNEDELPKWLLNLKHQITKTPGYWRELEPMRYGFEVLDMAREIGFDLRIATKGSRSKPSCWTEKLEWCVEHVPDAKVTITEEKSLLYGKALIDDYPPYAIEWLKWRPRGVVLMPEYWYNRSFKHERVFKYGLNNMEKVKELLQKIYDREPGELTNYDIKS